MIEQGSITGRLFGWRRAQRGLLIAALIFPAALLGAEERSAIALSCEIPAWRLMYRHDADGRPVAGSKASLLAAIRRGDSIRIAWGGAFKGLDSARLSVEHAADAVFVTIAGGTEVVAQIDEHVAQSAYHDETSSYEQGGVMWRGLFSTTGRFDAIWVDRGTGRELRRQPQKAWLAWLAFAPEPRCDNRPPLELAVEGGVVRRPERP